MKGDRFDTQRHSGDGAGAERGLSSNAVPGKQTLTTNLASAEARSAHVQLKATGTGAAPEEVHEVAARGVDGASQALPHGNTIQRLFGRHDISGVRAQVGGPAGAANERLGAMAYATGNVIGFRDAPDLHTAAHEAAHVVQQRGGVALSGGIGRAGDRYEQHADAVADLVTRGQSAEHLLGQEVSGSGAPATQRLQFAGGNFDQFGQARSDATRNLICDLTSPLVVGSEPHYRLGQHGAEVWSAGASFSYRWTMSRRAGGPPVFQQDTSTPEIRIPARTPGQYRVEVVVLDHGSPSAARMSLDQDVVAESASLRAGISGTSVDRAQTMRELVNDFRQYIIAGANATGGHGITPLYLASVLFIEVLNRPKSGRESELQDIDSTLSTLERGGWTVPILDSLNHSLGVGQIRQSTAAMAVGATPPVEQDRDHRGAGRDQINANYDALPLATKRMLFGQLEWPKSNIAMAARVLSTLKNRANRYPTMTRAQFVANERAAGVVATEYNSGGTSTPAADAAPAGYGQWAWQNMQDPVLQEFFPNT